MPYLTKKQLAEELNIPITGVQALTRRRVIPVIRLGHRTPRYDLTKVKAAIEKLEVKAVS